MPRPPGPSGLPKTPGSGRKRGSIDREQRKLLTDKMASDLMHVYQKLGGRAFLLKFAEENPTEFIRQGLSRLFPQPIKEDPELQLNQQFNIGNISDFEAAKRIAFTLYAGLNAQGQDPVAEREPYTSISPQDACRVEPEPDPEREAWGREVQQTPEERLNSETLDDHVNRRAFAERPKRPAWMPRKSDLL